MFMAAVSRTAHPDAPSSRQIVPGRADWTAATSGRIGCGVHENQGLGKATRKPAKSYGKGWIEPVSDDELVAKDFTTMPQQTLAGILEIFVEIDDLDVIS